MNWFGRNVKCPVCRYDIRQYRPTPDATQNPEGTMDVSSNLPCPTLPVPNQETTFARNMINLLSNYIRISDQNDILDASGQLVFEFYIP